MAYCPKEDSSTNHSLNTFKCKPIAAPKKTLGLKIFSQQMIENISKLQMCLLLFIFFFIAIVYFIITDQYCLITYSCYYLSQRNTRPKVNYISLLYQTYHRK